MEAVLAGYPWRRMTWQHGTEGPLTARFAVRVRVGNGAAFGNNRRLPGAGAWLVGEWRSSGERKYYLSNLPPRTSRRALIAAIKARWVSEQGHQQLKQELDLGHFEGSRHASILDGAAPTRPDDPHRVCLLAASPSRRIAFGDVGGKSHRAFRDRHHR